MKNQRNRHPRTAGHCNVSLLETGRKSRQKKISKDVCDLSNEISNPELMVTYRKAIPN